MRLKYYLRGAGIGVFVSTLILMIAFAVQKPTMSDEDIIKEATKLGMVFEEDKTADKAAKNTDKKNTTTDAKKEDTPVETVSFQIARGDTSAIVSAHLQEMGLVDDGEAFDKFLSEQDFDNMLQPGEFSIPKNSSFLDIAQILTTKKE